MRSYHQAWIGFVSVGLWWFGVVGLAQAQAPGASPPPPTPTGASQDDDVEVMTRGPIHEAYAEPVARGEGAPVVVAKKPPDPIEEMPPDTKPEGDNIVWVSGYWAWDEDRDNFIWISGVWRAVPANHTWVPGYWTEAEGGYQWVSGFWMPEQAEEVQYLPEPPATLEQGPTSPAPSEDYFWNPGYYSWYETRYVWRPGFWTACYPDWLWVPAHYCWTPRGWVFIDGYWDYPLVNRGVLFAPICFRRPILHWAAFQWCPAVVIQPSILTFHLFVRPRYCHYYFGDYYAVAYEGRGFRPWFHYHGRHGFDPLFTYYRWHNHRHMHDAHWESNIHGWFNHYRNNEHERPPHTLLAQHQLIEKGKGRADLQLLQIGKPMKDLAGRHDAFTKFTTISQDQRTRIQQANRQFGEFKQQRLQLESAHRIKPPGLGDPKLGLKPDVKPGLKPEAKTLGKAEGKPGAGASGLTLKHPEKVQLPKRPDLGSLGAKPTTPGPKLTAPGQTMGKPGVTMPKSGTTGPKVTVPQTTPGFSAPKSSGQTQPLTQPKSFGQPKTMQRAPGPTTIKPPSSGGTTPKFEAPRTFSAPRSSSGPSTQSGRTSRGKDEDDRKSGRR